MSSTDRNIIESVARAIDLLEALNRSPVSTVLQLHRWTGMPKSTIVRLLRTLEAKGLVTQSSSYGSYRLLHSVTDLAKGYAMEPLIISLAEPLMIEFTRHERWPLALGLFDKDAIVVRASTIPYTSLAGFHSSLNVRLGLLEFALGRAFLAHCSPSQQQLLLDMQLSDRPDQTAALPALLRELRIVREQGFAQRHSPHTRSSTIAVPVFEDERIAASLCLTWITAAMPLQQAIENYVPKVKDLAQAIGDELRRQSSATRRLSMLEAAAA